MSIKFESYSAKIASGISPSVEELVYLLQGNEDEFLFKQANEVCLKEKGNEVLIRAILEFSNYCSAKCTYCGLNATNREADRYRMDPEEIVNVSVEAFEAGYKTIVLQSGEDRFYKSEIISKIISDIKKRADISITLSIGERTFEELDMFRKAGADRYLLKHETSDFELYNKIHSGDKLQDRIDCLRNIKKLGYETGSGFMIGIPGQTYDIIAKDLLLLKELQCDMAGIGPFIAHNQTPMKGQISGDPVLTRRAIALTRLLLPKSHLPATTSLGIVDPKERDLVFTGGANVIMRKVTPWAFRAKYEIYPTNLGEQKDIKTARIELENFVKSFDRIPV